VLGAPTALAWLEGSYVGEDHGQYQRGTFAPARPRYVYLAGAAHAVDVEPGANGVVRLTPAGERRQLVQESVVPRRLQEVHPFRVRADRVRDIQQRKPHLRRDVVRHGLREDIGSIRLAEPRLQLLVQPPGGLDPRHGRLTTLRIEQPPLQLLDVRRDELDQRGTGLPANVALHGGDGRLVAIDQLGDDGGIGLDTRRRTAGHPG